MGHSPENIYSLYGSLGINPTLGLPRPVATGGGGGGSAPPGKI